MSLFSDKKKVIIWCLGFYSNAYFFITAFDQTNVMSQRSNLARKMIFGLGILFHLYEALVAYLRSLSMAQETLDLAVDESLVIDEKEKGGRL